MVSSDSQYFAERPWVEHVFLFSAVMAQIITQLGTNYTLSLLRVLSTHFDANDGERTWFMSSFSLATGTLILVSGRIGDVYGLKKAIMTGYTVTIIGSLLSGVSFYVKNPIFFTVSRAIQGMGTSFILPNVLGVAGRIYSPGSRRKHMVFSLIGFASPLGGCLAPLLAGLIAVKTQYWNWMCYAIVIASVLSAAVTWWSTPDLDKESQPVDWIGCGLGITALVLFSFAWNEAGVDGWVAYLLVLLVVSLLVLAVFIWWEKTVAVNPLVPMNLDVRAAMSLLTVGLGWSSWGVCYYRYFVFLLYLRNYSALGAGASVTPAIISGTVATITVGYCLKHFSVYTLLLVAMGPFVAFNFILQYMPVHQSYFQNAMAIYIVNVWGLDWTFPLGSIILSDTLPVAHQGMAGSLITTAINYGMSVFLGIAGTVERQTLLHHPGDILAAHKACVWFATGLCFAALICAVVLFTMRKQETISESGPESNLELNPESQIESKVESNFESNLESKPESKPELKSKSELAFTQESVVTENIHSVDSPGTVEPKDDLDLHRRESTP